MGDFPALLQIYLENRNRHILLNQVTFSLNNKIRPHTPAHLLIEKYSDYSW